MGGYVFFRKDRSVRGSVRVAFLCERAEESIELYPGPDKWAEGLQVRIKRQVNMGGAAVGFY